MPKSAHTKAKQINALLRYAHELSFILNTKGWVKYRTPAVTHLLNNLQLPANRQLLDYLHVEDRWHAMRTFQHCQTQHDLIVPMTLRLVKEEQTVVVLSCQLRNCLNDPHIQGVLVQMQIASSPTSPSPFCYPLLQTDLATPLMEAMEDGVLITDSTGRIIQTNPTASRLLGSDTNSLMGRWAEELLPWRAAGEPSPLAQALREGIRNQEQVALHHGSSIGVEYTCLPLVLPNQERGCLIRLKDIAEQRQTQVALVHLAATLETRHWELEEAREKVQATNQERTRFFASITHEIRNPLNALLGMADLLSRSGLSQTQAHYVETLRESGKTLLHLINDLLDATSLEEHRLRLDNINFEAWKLFEDCVALFAPMAQEAGLHLICHLDPTLPPALVGDPYRLRQILTNLLSNAIKFTLHGHVLLQVSLLDQTESHVTLRIAIEDSGIGMNHALQQKLFQPFVQAENSPAKKHGSSGLGLAIVKQLVELMGGTLQVKSTPGEGSCFTLTLTLARAEGAQTWPPCTALMGKSYYLALDQPMARAALQDLLGSLGMAQLEEADQADCVLKKDGAASQPPTGPAMVPLTEAGSPSVFFPFRRHFLQQLLEAALYPNTSPLAPIPPPHSSAAASGPDAPSPWVLVVDDSLPNVTLLQALLWDAHIQSVAATTGLEALEQLHRRHFDLVLMDCQMPDMDGMTATQHCRAHMPSGPLRIPIIALTANGSEANRQQCLAAGMDDFLTKPIQQHTLLTLLKRWLPHFASQQANPPTAHPSPLQAPAPSTDDRTLSDLALCPLVDPIIADPLRQLKTPSGQNLFAMGAELFLKDLPDRQLRLIDSLQAYEGEELVKAAHLLRGAAANLGLKRLSVLCGQLEHLGTQQQVKEADRLRPHLESLLAECRTYLMDTLDQKASG